MTNNDNGGQVRNFVMAITGLAIVIQLLQIADALRQIAEALQ